MASVKEAKFGAEAKPAKEAKWKDDPVLHDSGPLGWRFKGADKNGPFSWATLTDPKFKEVIEKLHEFEGMTLAQMRGTGSHPIAKNQLCKEAQDRLKAIKQDDIDELMSFRLTGPNRVWCIQQRNLMRVLWWDPEHRVYPVLKDKADRKKLKNRR